MVIFQTSSVLNEVKVFIVEHIWVILLGLLFTRYIWNKLQPGLINVPGPSVAAYTRLWRAYDVWKGQAHTTAIGLHKKYGKYVRIGPNHVSISDPDLIPVIYNIKEAFTKTGYYSIQALTWKKRIAPNLFSTTDVELHKAQMRQTGFAYSLPNLLQSEDAVDSCIELFLSRMDEFARTKKPVDLSVWLQYLAFDVVAELTFAKKLGFLEQGKDIEGIMRAIKLSLGYSSLIGQIPMLHKFLLGNPILREMVPALEKGNPIVQFTLRAIDRLTSVKIDEPVINADAGGKDMLSRWASHGMSTKDIVAHTASNVFAGSDTTAIALRAVIYFLCRHPVCMEKLVKEIDKADKAGKLSQIITYKESSAHLPYLQAVTKEAMRLHPSVGLLLERHVPAEGLQVDGHFFRGGTIVGINPWVVNRNEEVFPQPERFWPERWLEASGTHLKQMDAIWEFIFGAGSRKCSGRYVSLLEMSKALPELFRRYEIELTHPEKEWRIDNHFFVDQHGLICNVKRREV